MATPVVTYPPRNAAIAHGFSTTSFPFPWSTQPSQTHLRLQKVVFFSSVRRTEMTGHEVRIFFSYEKLGGGYWGNFWVIGKSFFFWTLKKCFLFLGRERKGGGRFFWVGCFDWIFLCQTLDFDFEMNGWTKETTLFSQSERAWAPEFISYWVVESSFVWLIFCTSSLPWLLTQKGVLSTFTL